MRARADANSSDSLLGTPRRTPASIRAWSFLRNNVAGDLPVSAATSATASPERRRCEICRRTECGYDLGAVTSYRSLCLISRIDDGALSGAHITRLKVEDINFCAIRGSP